MGEDTVHNDFFFCEQSESKQILDRMRLGRAELSRLTPPPPDTGKKNEGAEGALGAIASVNRV